MLIDARNIISSQCLKYDICIVGAGAAGITLAHELCNQNMTVLLLESGGINYERRLKALDQGEVDLNVHQPLAEYRRRQLGGATTIWGGRCVPFDALDFEVRSYVPYSGWPITKADLNPYYQRAHTYCEIGDYAYAIKDVLSESDRQKPMIPGLNATDIAIEYLYLFSPPTDFGKKYIEKLKTTKNIDICFHATCIKLIAHEDGKQVNSLQVSSPGKNVFSIVAKHFILASGGLEVTRLLLLSNDVHRHGIGNEYDLLGRFYMAHINYRFEVEFFNKDSLIWFYEKTPEGIYCQRQISIPENRQRDHELLNQRTFIERPKLSNPIHKSGVLSAAYLVKGLLRGQQKYRYLFSHIQNIVADVSGIVDFSHQWLTKRILSQRKLPSIILESRSGIYTLRMDSEQAPNPTSQVSLSPNKDFLGCHTLKVDWQSTELDRYSIEKSVEFITQDLARSGVGRLHSLPKILPSAQGGHHLGTTRMASTPRLGVVDSNCQVYGINNLFIASSSVFATASYSNPTLTIIALAIRLADHLKTLYQ